MLAHHLPLVERQRLGADHLIGLVSLAREHHHVAGAGVVERVGDGLAAAFQHGKRRRAVRHAGEDLVQNGVGVFRAGIIRGDDHLVREPRGDAPHFGALRPVAVAAAAEHDEHARVGKAADGRENIFQPVGRVRIINEHGVVRVRRHHLRPAAHALTK